MIQWCLHSPFILPYIKLINQPCLLFLFPTILDIISFPCSALYISHTSCEMCFITDDTENQINLIGIYCISFKGLHGD